MILTAFHDLPADILASRRGVLWNIETRDGKPTKVPYNPHRPTQRAAVDNPETWAPIADAIAAVEDGKADGIGVVLGDRLVGVDLDDVLDPETGALTAEAIAIIAALDSYTERSVSGTGIHILAYGELPPGGRRKGNVEMYSEARYFVLTGQHLAGTPTTIEDRTAALARLHRELYPPQVRTNGNGHGHHRHDHHVDVDVDDAALLYKAMAAKNGHVFSVLWSGDTTLHGGDDSAADLALCNLLAFWTKCDAHRIDRLFRQSGLFRAKWDGRRGTQTYGEMTVARSIAGCRETYQPSTHRRTPEATSTATASGVQLEDFYAYMPAHTYLFVPSREFWPARSVNARILPLPRLDAQGQPVVDDEGEPETIPAAAWLDTHRAVEQMTWTPGEPLLIRDRLVSEGGWVPRPGCTTFNLYRPPAVHQGDPEQAAPWLEHLNRVYPDDAQHIQQWLAHRVQRPAEKLNHAMVLGGPQGIGKDTLLDPVKLAVGPWNFVEVSPSHLLGRFNGFARSVVLRISEARDLGDIDRFAFYDHMKVYTAAPPDVLRVDEKNLREYSIWNVTGVIITTNHKTDGLYLPADDRRHYVAWSDLTRDSFPAAYWRDLWGWYASGGAAHVAALLATCDLSEFDSKAPPPKTPAFWDIVDANRAPEDAELADVLDAIGTPDALTLEDIVSRAQVSFAEWLRDRRSARQIPHRMETAGYAPSRNAAAKDGLWVVRGRRQAIYTRTDKSLRERFAAAEALSASGSRRQGNQ